MVLRYFAWVIQSRAQGRRHGRPAHQRQFPQAPYRRALGHGRAVGALKRSMVCAAWHMLSTGGLYRDLGGDYYIRRDPQRQTKRLVAQLKRLGHTVTLQEATAAPDSSGFSS